MHATRTSSTHRRIDRHAAACDRSVRPASGDRRVTRHATRVCRSADCSNRSLTAATYRRRRAIVGTILAVLVAVSIVTAHDVLAGSGGEPASAAVSQPAHVRGTVTAQPGDTLWSIAQSRHGEVSISRYVDAMVDLNGGASIQAGQSIVLP